MTKVNCALCNKEYNEENYGVAYRTTEIRHGEANSGSRYVVSNWMYRPRLTEDELFILGRGEHDICTRRTDCINRRLNNLLKQIKRLADNHAATPGERDAANDRLGHLLKKYNIDPDELIDNPTKQYRFSFNTVHEKHVLFQIYCKVTKSRIIKYSQSGNNKRVYFELTKQQAIELNKIYYKLREEFKKELEIFVDAFVHKHNLYSGLSSENDEELSEEELEELEELERMLQMARSMKDIPLYTEIESGIKE